MCRTLHTDFTLKATSSQCHLCVRWIAGTNDLDHTGLLEVVWPPLSQWGLFFSIREWIKVNLNNSCAFDCVHINAANIQRLSLESSISGSIFHSNNIVYFSQVKLILCIYHAEGKALQRAMKTAEKIIGLTYGLMFMQWRWKKEQNHQETPPGSPPARTQTLHIRPRTQQSGQYSHTQNSKRKRSRHSEPEHEPLSTSPYMCNISFLLHCFLICSLCTLEVSFHF